MWSRTASWLRSAVSRHPFLFNCGSYGALCGMAEVTQQSLEDRLGLGPAAGGADKDDKEGKGGGFNRDAILRIVGMGTFAMAPALYGWYKVLDARLPGKAWATVAKKLALDATVASVPLYSAFYIGRGNHRMLIFFSCKPILHLSFLPGMSYLEGKENLLEEWRAKMGPTYVLAMAFWLPAQTFNFLYIPPDRRVLFIAACTFVELNGLCILKRIQPHSTSNSE